MKRVSNITKSTLLNFVRHSAISEKYQVVFFLDARYKCFLLWQSKWWITTMFDVCRHLFLNINFIINKYWKRTKHFIMASWPHSCMSRTTNVSIIIIINAKYTLMYFEQIDNFSNSMNTTNNKITWTGYW